MLRRVRAEGYSAVNRDKRASLSSGLLGLKDAAPADADGTSSGTAASSDTAPAESRANVLYTKGAASASGFRPNQWSFDGPATAAPAQPTPIPTPEPQRLVMPFPVKASAALPATPTILALAKKPVLVAVAVVVGIALGIAIVAAPHRAGDAPVAALPAAPPPPPLAAAAPDAFTKSGSAELMARGDYERAAEQGGAPAMTAVGKTFDPLFLEQVRVRGSRGAAGKAADWYRRAGAAGDAEAEQRLKRFIARYAG